MTLTAKKSLNREAWTGGASAREALIEEASAENRLWLFKHTIRLITFLVVVVVCSCSAPCPWSLSPPCSCFTSVLLFLLLMVAMVVVVVMVLLFHHTFVEGRGG